MNSSEGQEKLMYLFLGVAGLVLGFVGLAMLTNRVSCGGWATPDSPFEVLGFFNNGAMSAFGTYQGCAASIGAFITTVVVLLVVILVAVVAIKIAEQRYKQSDRYLIRELKFREGMAKRTELRRVMGRRRITKKAKEVRPTQDRKARRDPQSAGFWRGTARGIKLYVSLEESQLLLGPPRSGKGVGVLIGDIIDAPGPVITTSSRADNLAATMEIRKKPLPGQTKERPVMIFDPQGISGQSTNVKWSPMSGCTNPQVANQRATSLIASTGLNEQSNNSEWAAPATTIMECLLHAAALGDRPVDDLMIWGNSEAEAKAAVQILKAEEKRGRAAIGWAESLESIINGDPRMRGNQWFGVRNAVKGLAVPNVRDALRPMSEAETFDIDEFLTQCGTLYIIGTKTGGSSAGPFLIAMMDAITERAREIAAQSKGNRLDPPLSLPLDEIANIAKAWPGLIPLMSDGGGVGINAHPVFQSRAQIRDNWGHDADGALWEAANVVVQLRGSKDTDNLRAIQELSGQYEHRRDLKAFSSAGSEPPPQFENRDVITKDELHRLPMFYGIILAPGARLIFAKLRPFFKRKDAKEIKQAKKTYYAKYNIDETTDRARGWQHKPGNTEEDIDTLISRRQQSPQEYKAALDAASSSARASVLDQIPGKYWDEDTGTIGAGTSNGTSEEDLEKYRPAAAETNTSGAGQPASRRGINWG